MSDGQKVAVILCYCPIPHLMLILDHRLIHSVSVDEIRGLPLLGDCRTTACIGGLVCHLATSQELGRAAEIYDLSDNEIQEPSLLGAALLLDGAEDKYELESACLPLSSLLHWPPEQQSAYGSSQLAQKPPTSALSLFLGLRRER